MRGCQKQNPGWILTRSGTPLRLERRPAGGVHNSAFSGERATAGAGHGRGQSAALQSHTTFLTTATLAALLLGKSKEVKIKNVTKKLKRLFH